MGLFNFFGKGKKDQNNTMPPQVKPQNGPQEKPQEKAAQPIEPTTPKVEAPSQVKQEEEPDVKEVSNMKNGKKIKYYYDHVRVFTPKELNVDLDQLEPGDEVTLKPDPQNAYDKNAVKVEHGKYPNVGYLNKGKIYEMANDYLKANCPTYAHIDSIDTDAGRITLFIAFYGSPRANTEVFKLTGSSGKKAQESLDLINEEDRLYFGYDEEKDKYAVSSIGEVIGYLPKKAEPIAEDYSQCTVAKIEMNDSGKYEVYVYFE